MLHPEGLFLLTLPKDLRRRDWHQEQAEPLVVQFGVRSYPQSLPRNFA